MIRRRDFILPPIFGALIFGALVLVAFYGAAWAGPAGPPSLASESGIAAWWESGALAGPITGAAAILLVVRERLSLTRWPGLGWLRRGSVRAYLSIATGAVLGLLPQAVDGSLTMGGVCVALLGGLVAFRPGGGERRTEAAGEIEAPS